MDSIAKAGQGGLHRATSWAIAGDKQAPGPLLQALQSPAEEAVGSQLIARAHHRDGKQPGLGAFDGEASRYCPAKAVAALGGGGIRGGGEKWPQRN